MSDPRRPDRVTRAVLWALAVVVVLAVPFVFADQGFRLQQFSGWMAFAIAAAGLNLLTGYNGQISVGHGALYGIGAYTVALLVSEQGWPFLATIPAAAVLCFVVGVVVGLPALRIKGLYLALVTLAVATLFPLVVEQFSSLTGGRSGKSLTSLQLDPRCVRRRGEEACLDTARPRAVRWESPIDGLNSDQWKYFLFLAITAVMFFLMANLVRSRIGRSLVAIRDNEVAAAVSGVDVARTKILTFGVSAAMAGVGGAVFALNAGTVNPTSFTLLLSIYLLVAVVIGGPSSVMGAAIGAVVYGVFIDVISPELPERAEAATPLILGILLVLQMFFAPFGIVGFYKKAMAKVTANRMLAAAKEWQAAVEAQEAAAAAAGATTAADPSGERDGGHRSGAPDG
jgi:branched-chain amino acid transport system permease protein